MVLFFLQWAFSGCSSTGVLFTFGQMKAKEELVRSYPYNIRTYQVGGDGHLLLHHLFNVLQDVAHRDAMQFGFGFPHMLKHDRLWVLSRMTVESDALPEYCLLYTSDAADD